MATPQAKNRYRTALRDNSSPTAKGRSKVLNSSSPSPPPPPPPNASSSWESEPKKKKKGSVVSKWQQAAQDKFNSSVSSSMDKKHAKAERKAAEAAAASAVPKPFSHTSPRAQPPPPPSGPPPSLGSSRRSNNSKENAPQLVHQKRQWDADKDIPRGTVADSPFRPAPEPHSPQVRQQKQQWDAQRDIPRGTVKDRAPDPPEATTQHQESMDTQKKAQWNIERDIPKGAVSSMSEEKLWSPRSSSDTGPIDYDEVEAELLRETTESRKKLQWEESEIPKGAALRKTQEKVWSPRNSDSMPPKSPKRAGGINYNGPRATMMHDSPRTLGDADVKAADSPKRQWEPESEIPLGAVSQSRIKTNRIFFADSPEGPTSPQLKHQKKQWEPEKDIPRGKVRGMSNIFDGSGTSNKQVAEADHGPPQQPPLAHTMEPVEPAQTSPMNASRQIVKPTPLPASRSEEFAASPAVSNEQPTFPAATDATHSVASDFYAAGAAGETDPWHVPDDSLNAIFGKGTWGEAANPSHSNDEYDERDWFQSGSFNVEDKKRTSAGFDDFQSDGFAVSDSFPPMSVTKTSLDESSHHDDDDFLPAEDSGSFAAAIQPVVSSRRNLTTKPTTVLEDPDEEDAATQIRATVVKKTPVKSQASPSNALKLKQMLESGGDNLDQPSHSRSTSSANSKKSKGAGGFRKKSDKNPETPTDKKRRGLFKLFSGRKQSTPEGHVPLQTNNLESSDDVGTRATPRRKTPKSLRKAKAAQKAETKKGNSLKNLTADVEKARSHGVISTRDDSSAVSEMTNATEFVTKVTSNEEGQLTKSPNAQANQSPRESSLPEGNSDLKPAVNGGTERGDTIAAADPDPFDVSSPMFSSGDPWSTLDKAELKKASGTGTSDAFSDPFFSSPEKIAVEVTATVVPLETDKKEVDSSVQVPQNSAVASEQRSVQVTADENDVEKEVISRESPQALDHGPLTKYDDAPDPELEIMSSDDEAENNDPATENELFRDTDSIKKNTKLQERVTKSPTNKIAKAPKSGMVFAPLDELNNSTKRSVVKKDLPAKIETTPERSTSAAARLSQPMQMLQLKSKEREAAPLDEMNEMLMDAPTMSKSKPAISARPADTHVVAASQPGSSEGSPHTIESVASEKSLSKLLEHTAGSNLTYKMRMKRYEKKMQRAKAMEEGGIQNLPPKAQQQHVSTSAYLTRFKSKGTNKGKGAFLDESDALSAPPLSSRSPFQPQTAASTSNYEVGIDAIPSIEAKGSHISSGSRSSRRNLRSKGKSSAPLVSVPQRSVAASAAPISKLQEQVKTEPRSVMKRAEMPVLVTQLSPTSPKDPMHRAGLRLLALAVIPIQAEMRRFLAKREALNRMWAIIVIQASARRWIVQRRINREDEAALIIQSYFADYLTREYARVLIQAHVRRWLVEKSLRETFSAVLIQTQARGLIVRNHLKKEASALRIQSAFRGWKAYSKFWQQVLAAIQIQAAFRGWYARDSVEDQHYCATQIQRIFRGYISTMAVYEDIYKVTLVQSFVRMKIAVDNATYKLAFVIQMQSIIRGFLVRRKLERMNEKTTTVQRYWRGHMSRLNYQFDLLDIILVQNIFRRKLATRELEGLKQTRAVESAIVIQTRWRSYDCTMNYLHYLADVLIIQSAVRRWAALKELRKLQHNLEFRSALSIQKTWRGFVCYAEYMFNIADIVIAQTQVRCWVARRKRQVRAKNRDMRAATAIQTQWRGHVAKAETKERYNDIVACQSVVRRRNARRDFRRSLLENCSAETIQSAWISYLIWRDENVSATCIQRMVRGNAQRDDFAVAIKDHRAAIKIQSAWRRFWHFSNFIITLDSAIVIQSHGRSYLARAELESKHCQATVIQSTVRSYMGRRTAIAKSMVKALLSASAAIGDKEAGAALVIQTSQRSINGRTALFLHRRARAIQSAWRSFVCYTDFIFTLSDVVTVQRIARGFVHRKLFARKWEERRLLELADSNLNNAAVKIQKLYRGYDQKQKFWYLLGCVIQIQCVSRGFVGRLNYKDDIGSIIVAQSMARRWLALRQYKQLLLIESLISGATREETEKHQAAITLQTWYRYDLQPRIRVAAAIKVQSFFRMVKAMVDSEIKAEKKRRKIRKKLRNRTKDFDEAVLEDAWDSVSLSGRPEDSVGEIVQAEAAVATALSEYRSRSAPRQGRQDSSSGRKHVRSKSRDSSFNKSGGIDLAKAAKKVLLPPSYYDVKQEEVYEDKPTDMVRLRNPQVDESDAMSEVSGLTSSSVIRPPPSRLQRMGNKDMTEDLSLEEAWVDMEIQNTKQKRKTTAKGKRHLNTRPRSVPRDPSRSKPKLRERAYGHEMEGQEEI
jgi:hypothetical protein